jgi:heat shock protein HtpX
MCIASGLNVMPKVYIIDTPEPNAFAVGLKPKRAAVAVTAGLLSKLDRDELQGVIAHEIAHIQNRDTLFMTLAGVTVGAIILLSELAWRSLRFGSLGRGRGSSSKNNGQIMIVIMVVAVIMAVLAPILARILYFACSRRREYLADACAAQYTRFPQGLAGALDKISGQAAQRASTATVSRTLAPMYIINPLAARGKKAGIFSTHPSTDERIQILRGMTAQASLAAYEEAYHALHPKDSALTPSIRAASVEQPVRDASAAGAPGDKQKNWRDAQDLLHKVDKYAMLACACGLNIKVPPDYGDQQISCPKCGTVHPVPTEIIMAMQALKSGKPHV